MRVATCQLTGRSTVRGLGQVQSKYLVSAGGCAGELPGWQCRLFACEVRSPTGNDTVHWLPLHQLLNDPDFRPNVLSF
jgi:hypothetical protein